MAREGKHGERAGPLAIALVALVAVLALPTTADAATVQVAVGTGDSQLTFEAAAGEGNVVTIAPAGEEGELVRYSLRDSGAGIVPGPGCSGDPSPGGEVTCLLPRSIPPPPDCGGILCSGRPVVLGFRLGDGEDALDATAVPADDGGGGGVHTFIHADEGSDRLSTGASSDYADPGPGADHVTTGDGIDEVVAAGASPDEADHLDLGPGYPDRAVYASALGPLELSLDGIANDGAAGEDDNLLEAEFVQGGAGDDLLIGSHRRLQEELVGGAGADTIAGLEGDDLLWAGDGDDRILGGPGADGILGLDGNDVAAGGPGPDRVWLDSGDDRGTAGAGRDLISGGPGNDRVRGGGGPDRVYAGYPFSSVSNLVDRDRLDCGRGKDRAGADRRDRVRRCERVKVFRGE